MIDVDTLKGTLSRLADGAIEFVPPPAKGSNRHPEEADHELLYPPHRHAPVDMCQRLAGELLVARGDQWVRLDHDAFVVFTPDAPHGEQRVDAATSYRLLWVALHPHIVNLHVTVHNPGKGYFVENDRHHLQTPFNVRLWELSQSGDFVSDPLERAHFQALLMETFYYLIHNFHQTRSSTAIYHDNIVEQVKRYVAACLGDPDLSLDKLAHATLYSTGHLNAIFKEKTGVSIHQHLNERRMREAATMLRSKRCLVKDVAAAVGFTDPLYFSKAFKKRHGVSPKKFVERQC